MIQLVITLGCSDFFQIVITICKALNRNLTGSKCSDSRCITRSCQTINTSAYSNQIHRSRCIFARVQREHRALQQLICIVGLNNIKLISIRCGLAMRRIVVIAVLQVGIIIVASTANYCFAIQCCIVGNHNGFACKFCNISVCKYNFERAIRILLVALLRLNCICSFAFSNYRIINNHFDRGLIQRQTSIHRIVQDIVCRTLLDVDFGFEFYRIANFRRIACFVGIARFDFLLNGRNFVLFVNIYVRNRAIQNTQRTHRGINDIITKIKIFEFNFATGICRRCFANNCTVALCICKCRLCKCGCLFFVECILCRNSPCFFIVINISRTSTGTRHKSLPVCISRIRIRRFCGSRFLDIIQVENLICGIGSARSCFIDRNAAFRRLIRKRRGCHRQHESQRGKQRHESLHVFHFLRLLVK